MKAVRHDPAADGTEDLESTRETVEHLRSVREHSWVVANEFAHVWVSVDTRGNTPRLLVQTPENDHIFLDPLELACITRWPHEDLAYILRTAEYR